ncbi:MAG TPA: phage baseplate assembly protein V [Kineosporiaceae bacterium]|nr:phage baseplate assembly protein V [Kineosporiaceae bacterium]
MSSPVIHLNGTQLAWTLASQLLSVTVDRGLRRPSRAEIVIADDDFALLAANASAFAPGTALSVAFLDSGTPRTVFTGAVTGLRVSCPNDGDHRTAVTLLAEDAGHGLGAVQQVVSTANADLADVLSSVLSSYLTGSVTIAGLPAGQRDAVLVALSPLDLLEQVCDRYGVEWWVDPASGALNVAALPTSPTEVSLTLGEDLASLDFETGGTTTGTVSMRGWNPAAKAELTAEHAASAASSAAPSLLQGSSAFGRADTARRYEIRAASSVDAADVTAQAGALGQRAARAGTRLVAAAFGLLPGLNPRDDLVLVGAGPLSGNHPVTAVRHEWGERVVTWITAGARDPAGRPGPVPSEGAGHGATVFGAESTPAAGGLGLLLPGLITDISDPQGWGRVKVKLPTLGSDIQTGWARTLLPAAGPNRGFVVPHRVNDEVVVGFEEGDLQRPIVLGAVHNGQDAPPTGTAGRDQDLSAGLTTADGHQIVLTDASSSSTAGLSLKHAEGHQILITGDQVLLEAQSGTPLKLQAGSASIVLDAQGNVTIKGVKVTVTGTSAAEIAAPSVSVKADTTLALQGTTSTTVKGGTVAVTADATATIKGATVAIN